MLKFFILFSLLLNAIEQKFPADFQWCVATAGHQIEGDNVNSDWWAWEQKPGKIKNNERSGKASYHLQRMAEDVARMKDLGAKTYRFSIEWSRIEPRPGQYDELGIGFYAKLLAELKSAGIAPFVTIHHFVQPEWFTSSGGWRRPDAPEVFLSYVKKLDALFGSQINYWVTFNEPMVLLAGAYGLGIWPPGETHWNLWDPLLNILNSHSLAYHYLHSQAAARGQKISIGMAHHLRPLATQSWYLKDLVADADFIFNYSIPWALKTGDVQGLREKAFLGLRFPWPARTALPQLKNTQDFYGINYYTREMIQPQFFPPALLRNPFPGMTGSDLNWGIDPEGFYQVLSEAHRDFPKIPFYITENGIADSQDQWRQEYFLTHIQQLKRAMNEFSHPVVGYCYWSLMDNFEWQEGFGPRFGILHVDYKKNGERSAKPSTEIFKKVFTGN